jgi:Na+-driven multidrug efflux pump
MLVLTLLCQWRPQWLIHGFTQDPAVVAVGADYLRIIAWNFVASGLIFTASGMFQAVGNTLPALLSSATRLLTFAVPALWLSQRGGFTLRDLWHLSVATVTLQMIVSLVLLRMELRRPRSLAVAPGV